MEDHIEDLIYSDNLSSLRPTASEVGKAHRIDDAIGRYVVFLKNTFPNDLTLDGLRIVLDCANERAYRVAPTVLEELGAEVISVGVDPTEKISMRAAIPTSQGSAVSWWRRKRTSEWLSMVMETALLFVDGRGKEVDGDHILAICGLDLLTKGCLKKKTLVTTVMSNMASKGRSEKQGKSGPNQSGDRYVVEEMVRGDYNLGGEQSGHTIFLDYNTTCDGILTALQVLAIMKREETSGTAGQSDGTPSSGALQRRGERKERTLGFLGD